MKREDKLRLRKSARTHCTDYADKRGRACVICILTHRERENEKERKWMT